MDENLWGLVSGSFEKFASDCALTYYDSENPEDCLSLTFLQLFQDSEVIYKELEASKKKSPVGLRFTDDSVSMVAAYAAIIATIRSVLRPVFLSSTSNCCQFWLLFVCSVPYSYSFDRTTLNLVQNVVL
jgi:hypothetical protein